MTRVLCVVPTLGEREEWLAESLASIRRQLVPADTVVVAPPHAAAARDIAAQMDMQFHALSVPGLSVAINCAWRMFGSDHDYWAWLGDDDLLSPISLLASAEHLDADPTCVAVYGRARVIKADGMTSFAARPGRLASVLLPFVTDQVPQPGSLFRADAVRRVGYLDESLAYSMDYDLLLKLRRLGPLHYLPVELAAVRAHAGRISDNRGDDGREEVAVRERNLTPAQRRIYSHFFGGLRVVDRAYSSILRRMPPPRPPLVEGRPYSLARPQRSAACPEEPAEASSAQTAVKP